MRLPRAVSWHLGIIALQDVIFVGILHQQKILLEAEPHIVSERLEHNILDSRLFFVDDIPLHRALDLAQPLHKLGRVELFLVL